MERSDHATRHSARHAYELGRFRLAVVVAWPAFAMVALTMPLATERLWHTIGGAALVVSTIALRWRGGSMGRAVAPALTASVAPLVLPFVTMQAYCSSGNCATNCMAACAAAGVVAGGWFGLRGHRAPNRVEYLVSGLGLVALAGTLGCACMGPAVGVAGVTAVAATFALVASPLTLMRTAH